MLGRLKIGQLHFSFIKMAQRRKRLEIRGLYEAEVVRTDAVDIIHDNPFVLADALPYVGSLAGAVFRVNLLGMEVVKVVDAVGNHVLNACRIVLRYIGHEVASVGHRTYVSIKHLRGLVRILEE